jgi:hypothetical protein
LGSFNQTYMSSSAWCGASMGQVTKGSRPNTRLSTGARGQRIPARNASKHHVLVIFDVIVPSQRRPMGVPLSLFPPSISRVRALSLLHGHLPCNLQGSRFSIRDEGLSFCRSSLSRLSRVATKVCHSAWSVPNYGVRHMGSLSLRQILT